MEMDIDSIHYMDRLRPIALALPGMTEGTSYGTPGFHVNKKFIARLEEDGITLVIRTFFPINPGVFLSLFGTCSGLIADLFGICSELPVTIYELDQNPLGTKVLQLKQSG